MLDDDSTHEFDEDMTDAPNPDGSAWLETHVVQDGSTGHNRPSTAGKVVVSVAVVLAALGILPGFQLVRCSAVARRGASALEAPRTKGDH
uniref:Transmembrane protein n=1 Tax=Steinernema glaseri TaxID=37863 RepID=A0A1I8AVZ1_9BILA